MGLFSRKKKTLHEILEDAGFKHDCEIKRHKKDTAEELAGVQVKTFQRMLEEGKIKAYAVTRDKVSNVYRFYVIP